MAVLGPTECVAANGEIVVPSRLDRKLLAALAVDRHRVWSVDELGDAIWGEGAPVSGKLVRNRVSVLRARLGRGFIVSVADGYRLGSEVRLDTDRIEALTHDAFAQSYFVDSSLPLWRGEPFSDLEDWPTAHAARTQVRTSYSVAAEQAAVHDLERGAVDQAVATAQWLVGFDPYREQGWDLLARSLSLAGRQRDALDACQRARNTVAEIGLDLSDRLLNTERRIAANDPSLQRRSTDADLPLQPVDSFVGRLTELAQLEELTTRSRIVTVVGLGGLGKTRLAVELARRYVHAARPTPVIVDLLTATTDDGVAEVATRAIGLLSSGDPNDALGAWATGARCLVVLDNAEHVRAGAAALARLLIERSTQVRVIATSRIPLAVPGEVVFALTPLIPAEAMALFDIRSAIAHDRDAVRHLCAAVDGLPFAIELAAGRADAVSPEELAARLSIDPSTLDRSVSLRANDAALDRHSRVSELIDWAVSALDPSVRSVLGVASLFVAPFTLAACEHVTGNMRGVSVVDALTTLVRQSLVQVQFGSPTRYRLLELVRPVAAELAPQLVNREGANTTVDWSRRYVSWAATVVDATADDDGASLVADIPNLQKASQLACDANDVSAALRIARAIIALSAVGRTEPRRWAAEALALDGADQDPGFSTVAGRATFYLAVAGEIDEARAMAQRIARVAPGTSGDGWARHGIAVIDSDDKQDERALAIALAQVDWQLELAVRTTLALRWASSRPADALAHGQAALRTARAVDLPWAAQMAEYTCGVALLHVDPDRASYHLGRAQKIADDNGLVLAGVFTRLILLDLPDPKSAQLARDRDALERILTTGIDPIFVLTRVPEDLRAAGLHESAALVSDFLRNEHSALNSDAIENHDESVQANDSFAPTFGGEIRSVLDILRLLDEVG